MILKGVGIGRGVAVGPVLRMAEPLPEPKDEPRAASVSAEAVGGVDDHGHAVGQVHGFGGRDDGHDAARAARVGAARRRALRPRCARRLCGKGRDGRRSQMILKGVGLGRGVAVGPVLRMAEPLPEPKDEPRAASVSAEAENARVTKALAG